MIPLNPWEHQNAIKTLYSRCVGEVCDRRRITRMELDILLFLANNPLYDTATDMVELRFLSKSQVSASVKLLENKGYLRREYTKGNRKTAHLKICEAAAPIISDGHLAQEKFFGILFRDFTPEEIACLKKCFGRIRENIDGYLREERA